MNVRCMVAMGMVAGTMACGGSNAQQPAPSAATSTATVAAAPATATAPAATASATATATAPNPTATATTTLQTLPPGAPFTGSGTFRNVQFSVSCTQFTAGAADKDVAMETSQGFVLLSCHDPQTHVQINVTVAAPAVGDIVPKHSSQGSRVAVSVPGGEFISTSDGDNTGKISITGWDAGSRHITGTYTLSWPKDSSGQPGSLQGSFDVSNLATVK